MPDISEPVLQHCSNCSASIDITDQEPFAQVQCPECGESLRVRRTFGSFELVEILGTGGMGAVYRALDSNLNRHVALKLLRKEFSSNPEFVEQFAHEAKITALINHPNVVRVYSSGTDHGLLYLAMELVDKGSLDDLMTTETKVPEQQALDVGIQIAQGLEAAYSRGLIHRDVKPANILFRDANTAKIVDFGLAVPMDQAGSLGGEIWGTPYYVAPEKLANDPEDFRSDMYSLAASLFHAMAGRPPHDTEEASISVLREAKSKPVALRTFVPEVSSATAYAIDRAMHHEPAERFSSYAEFIQHLQFAKDEIRAALAKQRLEAQRAESTPPPPPKSRDWSKVGVAAAVIVGGAALFLFRDHIFGVPKPSNAESATAAAQSGNLRPEYEKAREQFSSMRFGPAAQRFRKLAENTSCPEPLRTWAAVHAALATTFAERSKLTEKDWKAILDKGPYSDLPEEQKQASFFLDLASRCVASEAPTAEWISDYSITNYEPIALLALGGKAWLSEDIATARSFFQAFANSNPEGGNAWLKEYKPIATACLDDISRLEAVEKIAAEAGTLGSEEKSISEIKAELAKFQLKGTAADSATAILTKLEQKLAAEKESEAAAKAEREAADTKLIAELKMRLPALHAAFRFNEARLALSAASMHSEKGRAEKDVLVKTAEWLAQFKLLLIRDILGSPSAIPIQRRTGIAIPGALNRATDLQLEIKTPYGVVPLPWSDVSLDTVSAVARSYIRPEAPPETRADREWLLGVFAHVMGRKTEAKLLLSDAAQLKPDYRAHLGLFIEGEAPAPASAPPAAPAAVAPPAQPPPSPSLFN